MRTLSSIQRRLSVIDNYGYTYLSLLRSKRLPAITARTLSASGDGIWYLLAAVLLLITTRVDADYILLLALAFAIERPIYWLLKNSFRRDRPRTKASVVAALLVAHDKFSFPSGHTCAAFLFATVTADYLPELSILLLFWASAVGASRVVVGVHYPTDVVAGGSLGLLIGEWVIKGL